MALKKVGDIFNPSKAKANTSKVNDRFDRKSSRRFSLYKDADGTLESTVNLRDLVKLPPDEDMELDDWIATHVVDFYNRARTTYAAIFAPNDSLTTKTCSDENCPVMSGGPKYEYLWQDDVKYKKPTKLSAPEYIFNLFEWVDSIINDENIFPTNDDVPFPKNFQSTCIKIFRRLYRIFVHLYIEHFDRLKECGVEAHANAFYKHFYYFVREHKMMDEKDYVPLENLTQRICTD